jgi:hypothetical protein
VIFVHHALEFLRKHRQYIANDAGDETMVVQFEYIIRCLQLISEAAEDRDVPQNVGGKYDAAEERHLARLTRMGSMKEQVEDAIQESMLHWHEYIMESVPMETARVARLKSMANLVNALATDLRQGCEAGNRLFKEIMGVDYMRQVCVVCKWNTLKKINILIFWSAMDALTCYSGFRNL